MHIHKLLMFVDHGPVISSITPCCGFSDKYVVTFLPNVDKSVHIVRQLSKTNHPSENQPQNKFDLRKMNVLLLYYYYYLSEM